MTSKRIITALTAVALSGLLLTGCTTTTGPTPGPSTASATPTPTTGVKVPPPASEDEAIKAADTVLKQYFVTRGEVNAAGGKNTAPLNAVATGKALDVAVKDAERISTGPILNVDQKNIDGPGKTEGAITYERLAAYGQQWEKVDNGLVTIHACQDASKYKVWASDGSEALRPDARSLFDYQVIYDTKSETWLVYNLVSLGQSC
ncbi:hypothetical protein ACH3VR_21860 [Microbacterium sp. B2969]|uniref:Lipoprotein n=1 Tax=Microbacterium alkaliflavum TaxID=3248839 RepID=A0ABW7QDP1_9MICO